MDFWRPMQFQKFGLSGEHHWVLCHATAVTSIPQPDRSFAINGSFDARSHVGWRAAVRQLEGLRSVPWNEAVAGQRQTLLGVPGGGYRVRGKSLNDAEHGDKAPMRITLGQIASLHCQIRDSVAHNETRRELPSATCCRNRGKR